MPYLKPGMGIAGTSDNFTSTTNNTKPLHFPNPKTNLHAHSYTHAHSCRQHAHAHLNGMM